MTKKALCSAAVGISLATWLAWPQVDDPRAQHAPKVENRVWIERMPDTPRQKFDVFVLIEDAKNPSEPGIGVFSRTSAFEGDFTVFNWWRKEPGKFRIYMLQKKKTHRLRAKTTDRGCEPFDYCLKLEGAPRGARKYGSMREWVIEGATTPQAALAEARALLD